MKTLPVLVYFFMVSFTSGYSQEKSDFPQRKGNFYILAGVARSVFEVNIPASKFATAEFRLGLGISKHVGKFEFKPSVLLGLKGTKPSYKVGQFYTQPGVPLLKLDDASSNRNHVVIDIPILFQYNLSNPDLGFRIGFDTRFWTPNNRNVDILTSKQEIGLLGGGCINLKKFSVGLDFYYGLSKIHGGSITYNGEFYTFDVINSYSQISVEVPLKKNGPNRK